MCSPPVTPMKSALWLMFFLLQVFPSTPEVTASHCFQKCINAVVAAPANVIHHLMDDDLICSIRGLVAPSQKHFICVEGSGILL